MRVRFAPSPDRRAAHRRRAHRALQLAAGARHAAGTLVLRIEDTDRERSTPENVEQILDALRWLELDWDEGPISQIEPRRPPPRGARAAARRGPRLPLERDRRRRQGLQGASTAPTAASAARPRREGAVRLRVPDEGETVVHDLIRGDTTLPARPPRRPGDRARGRHASLYNFAVAVDDLDAEHHARRPRRGPPLQHAQAAARARGARAPSRRSTRTCRCCTAPTARSSPSATAPRRCRSCATPATCPRRCATTSRCSAGATPTTRRSSRPSELVEPLRHRARLAQPGALRRAEAALDERPLPARARRRRAHAAPRGASPAATGLRDGGRDLARRRSRRWPTSGRWPGSSSTARPTTRRRARSGSTTEGRARARRRARGARRRRAVRRRARSRRRCASVVERRGAQAASDVFQPMRVALAGHDRVAGDLRDARGARPRRGAAADRRGARDAETLRRSPQQSASRLNQPSMPADNRACATAVPAPHRGTATMHDAPHASVTPISARRHPDAAGVQRRHNEGHGRRLTAAFEALEALPGARRVAQPPAAPRQRRSASRPARSSPPSSPTSRW